MKIPVTAHNLLFTYTRTDKSEPVHKHWSFHTYAKYTIEDIFRTWPLQEYVQQLQITQKRHLTEHKHFAAFGKIFLFHLLEKGKNNQLSKEINSSKHQSHLEKQWKAVSWNIPMLILNQLMNITIKEIDRVPRNSSGHETSLYHP